jgi:hypothetical protein
MHKTVALFSTLALSALLTGCAGSGPSTEAGAVTGGAIGMIAGAIIGHDSGNAANGAILGGLAGAVAGGAIGNSTDHERGTIYGSERSVMANPDSRGYRVARAEQIVGAPPAPPPTPTETVPPQPTPNAVWATGYWVYDGRTYTWMPSHWETPPPGARSYVAGHYENRNGQNVYVPGYWQ